jgi:hypothetical protein
MGEWIADDEGGVLAKAVAFATDRDRLATLRATLRERAGVAAVRRIALCAQPGGRAARHVGQLRGWRDGARGRVTRERGGARLEATFEPTLCVPAE